MKLKRSWKPRFPRNILNRQLGRFMRNLSSTRILTRKRKKVSPGWKSYKLSEKNFSSKSKKQLKDWKKMAKRVWNTRRFWLKKISLSVSKSFSLPKCTHKKAKNVTSSGENFWRTKLPTSDWNCNLRIWRITRSNIKGKLTELRNWKEILRIWGSSFLKRATSIVKL